MFNNRQAQTGSTHRAGAGLIHPVKAFENPRQIFHWDPQSRIRNPNLDLAAGTLQHGYSHVPPLFVELHGVIDQIEQGLLESYAISKDIEIRNWLRAEIHMHQAGGRFDGSDGVTDHLPDGDRTGPGARAAILALPQRQQIRGDIVEPDTVGLDDLHESPSIRAILEAAVEQSFRVASDGGERCAKFVRDICHEVAFCPLQPLYWCYVTQGGDGAVPGTAGERRRVDVKSESTGSERFQPFVDRFARLDHVFDDLIQPRGPDDPDEGHAHDVGVAARRVNERIIAERHVEPGIDRQNGVRHAG